MVRQVHLCGNMKASGFASIWHYESYMFLTYVALWKRHSLHLYGTMKATCFAPIWHYESDTFAPLWQYESDKSCTYMAL